MDWIDLAQDRGTWRAVLNAVINLWDPQSEGNFLTRSGPVSFSRKILLHEGGWLVTQLLSYLVSSSFTWRRVDGQSCVESESAYHLFFLQKGQNIATVCSCRISFYRALENKQLYTLRCNNGFREPHGGHSGHFNITFNCFLTKNTMILELHNALYSCTLVGCIVVQPVVFFNIEHPDAAQMRRPKHVGANK